MKSQSEIEVDKYKAWIAAQANKYVVTHDKGCRSPVLDSQVACEKWISENLKEGTRYFINKL